MLLQIYISVLYPCLFAFFIPQPPHPCIVHSQHTPVAGVLADIMSALTPSYGEITGNSSANISSWMSKRILKALLLCSLQIKSRCKAPCFTCDATDTTVSLPTSIVVKTDQYCALLARTHSLWIRKPSSGPLSRPRIQRQRKRIQEAAT